MLSSQLADFSYWTCRSLESNTVHGRVSSSHVPPGKGTIARLASRGMELEMRTGPHARIPTYIRPLSYSRVRLTLLCHQRHLQGTSAVCESLGAALQEWDHSA